MHMRSTIIAISLAFAAMLPLAGCGDNDNSTNNNSNDNTSQPTRTPTPARTVTPIPPTSTPVASSEPTSTDGVVATVTPTENVATPTQSPGVPTVTPTPTGDLCVTGEHIMVAASLDKPFAAFATTLAYPTDAVNIPGSGAAVGNRVVFNVTGGLNTASDDDDIGGDGVDDTLHASFVSSVDNPGAKVFTVTFDCIPGQAKPAAGAFTCTVVSASTSGADTIPDEVCTLDVR